MNGNILTITALLVTALQPMSAGAATEPGSLPGMINAKMVVTPAAVRVSAFMILAQNQNQNESQNSNANQNQGENQNQNQNQNENQNQNQNENQNQNQNEASNDGSPAALEAATSEAVTKPNYACFHDSPSNQGAKFCVEPGNQATVIPAGWNDRISSIEIVGKVKVTVCTDTGLAGTCAVFQASVAALPGELDDTVSSWKAE